MQAENQKERTDTELIEAAKRNPEAFGFLMERYEKPLFHYIRRLSQSPKEDVEDLLQEVFIKIYQKLNEYDTALKFSSWAYRVAHNHVIDHFRRSSARPRTNVLEDSEWEKIIHSAMPESKRIENKDCAEKVRECIEELPFNYREVMILRFIEEKEYAEIMDILAKPKGTVAILLARGKERLKKELREKNINCF